MKDRYGRTIDYMRISVTDRCNLRCRYCMPDGIESLPMSEILTLEEICTIAECASALGIHKIKVTGGEPLVRLNCTYLVCRLKAIPGIEKVTITTNGVLLDQYLEELIDAGIDGINISLDTRDRKRFQEITGSDCLPEVMGILKRASDIPVPLKVNAVSLDLGRENWKGLVELAREYPVDVRFIEMMPIGCGRQFPAMNPQELLAEMTEEYPGIAKDPRIHGFGPAVYYQIPGFQGSIGFISAIHGKFCDGCNRVRLTSQGFLKTCLCYEDGSDLRAIIRSGGTEADRKTRLTEVMRDTIFRKPAAHCFEQPGQITETHRMVSIGG
ncbi:MAG: GTP 3',8-cyclase MoaA [Lachnospiraceae bacterium]|nr:GTP 3',8-cyclase MoaA [Lachnospiraceae bacterium]